MARMIKSISNLVAIIIITLTAIVTFSTSLFAKPVAQWIFEDINKITNEYAAVILEPIQSIGGVTSFTVPYLEALQKKCKELGVFLIFDEVQTGFGRIGTPFFSGYSGVTPDMFTTAKGIASGFPLGTLFVSDAISAKVKIGDLGSTYGAGPVAMAAAAATVEALTSRNLFAHVTELDAEFKTLASIPGIEEVRGKGCLVGLKTKMPAKELMKALLERKIISGTSKDPMVLRLLPPVVITKDHIAELRQALTEILQ